MLKVDPAVIENYQQEITESGESTSYPEIKIIEEKADEDESVYINMDFLGLDLSKVPMQNLGDFKVLIIPIIYVITTFVNIKRLKSREKRKKKTRREENRKMLLQMVQKMKLWMNSLKVCNK